MSAERKSGGDEAAFEDFKKLDIRIGTVIEALPAESVHRPAFRLWIDFGPAGVKKSSAQITDRYSAEDLTGMQVIAVVNFPPKQIGKFMSECLVLGIPEVQGVTLLTAERAVNNGGKVS